QPSKQRFPVIAGNDTLLQYGLGRNGFICNGSTCTPCHFGEYQIRDNETYVCKKCPAERIELQLSEREREPPSESGSEVVAPSIKFQGSVPRSNKSSSSSLSATKQQARVAQLKLEQANKEVQQRAAEEQQLFEERLKMQAREHALAEKRRIRELEYEAEKLRLQTQLDGEYHPENLENRLRDFSDSDSETEYREIKERQPDVDDKTKVLADKPHFTSPGLQLPTPIKSLTERKGTLPSAIHPTNSQVAEECLDVSWTKELSKGSTERQAAVGGMSASIFAKPMPRLKLPHFSGDPLEWPQFIALFKCLVHDQPLTDTQRMTHLQSALTGDAKKAIGGMLNHGHLYKAALTELEAQFGSEEIVARAFMKTVFDHPKVPEGDLTQLRSFYNTLHVAVVTLNSLGYVHDLSSTVTTQRVLQKLLNLLKERWGEKKIQTHPTQLTLFDLDEWLGTRVRAKASRVEEWWRTDAFGTKYENETPRSVEDKKALEILENTVKHLGDRYEVDMLWRDQDVEFPDNRAMAEKRLKSTERRLKRDETLADKYCTIIDDYVNKGYAKKLPPKEASMPTSKQWFLPHHPVLNANKPGKVRIVMDAAAKHDGVSLNDKLLIGPDLLNNLQMQVMIFGAAASPCMANYVLRKTATDNCDDPSFNVDTIESVEKNFYMDDFLKSVQDEATAIRLSANKRWAANTFEERVHRIVVVYCRARDQRNTFLAEFVRGGFFQNIVGHYGTVAGLTGCKFCIAGTYVRTTDYPALIRHSCKVCPAGTTTDKWADYRACYCIKKFYRKDRFGDCIACNKGGGSTHGVLCNETKLVREGYWWQFSSYNESWRYQYFLDNLMEPYDQYDLRFTKFTGIFPRAYPCPRAASCRGLLQSVRKPCETGYGGPLCEVCQRKFYKSMSRCVKCPTLPWMIVQVSLISVAFMIIVLVLLRDERKEKRYKRTIADIMLARLKIVIGFYQAKRMRLGPIGDWDPFGDLWPQEIELGVPQEAHRVTSGTLAAFSYMDWPELLLSLSDYAKFVQFNVFQIAPIHCFTDTFKLNAYEALAVSVGMNVAVIVACVVYFQVRRFFIVRFSRKSQEEKEDDVHYCKSKCYRSAFLVLFVSFPDTCSRILGILPPTCNELCIDHKGKSCTYYLKADYTLNCYDEKHNTYVKYAYVGAMYPVVFPLFILVTLYFFYYRKHVKRVDTYPAAEVKQLAIVDGMKFIYENYSQDCWYWEIVEMVRKLAMTSGLQLIGSQGRSYVGMAAMGSGFYAVAFAQAHPSPDHFEHILQLSSLVSTFFNLSVGVLLRIPQTMKNYSIKDDMDDSLAITVMLVFANVAITGLLVVRYLVSLGQSIIAVIRHPQCSWECCFSVLLSAQDTALDDAMSTDGDLKALVQQDDAVFKVRL
ncbi:hypothetical protein QZH41_019783, partial [Actinostola sp. cb2023]